MVQLYGLAAGDDEAASERPVGPVLRVPGERLQGVPLAQDSEGHYVLPKGAQLTIAATPTPRRRSSRAGRDVVRLKPGGTDGYASRAVVTRLIDVLGSNTVADLLGVAKDRPGRWAQGEGLDSTNRAGLADLDALVGHVLATFTPEQASLWLVGDNAHLGARPLDVFRLRGSGPVIDAIAAHAQGAFA